MASSEQVMILSICGPLMNRIKMAFEHPKKNTELASNEGLKNLINKLGEQILPQWCQKNAENYKAVNEMHNLVYLLAYKANLLFFSGVIHTIID